MSNFDKRTNVTVNTFWVGNDFNGHNVWSVADFNDLTQVEATEKFALPKTAKTPEAGYWEDRGWSNVEITEAPAALPFQKLITVTGTVEEHARREFTSEAQAYKFAKALRQQYA